MVGLSLSLTALIASLYVFFAFRCLKNKRTKLHRNLFLAMFLQVSVRLIVYVDQWLARRSLDDPLSGGNRSLGIENTMILCEVCYAVMEYARTCVFTWMFLEGIHLHTTVVLVFRKKVDFLVFHLIGWGFPLFLVLVWGTTMATLSLRCWWGYHFSAYFWILEGPRMFIIMVNLVVLLNVVRVVMIKVQKSVSNEFQQIRKTIRAALLLLPLLGITNLLDIIPGPLDKSPVQFAVWSYTTHILSSFQGFFLSLLYCFLNREVKQAMKKHWSFIKFSYFNGIERKRIESRGHFNLTFISHLNSFRANIEDGPVLEEERETATL
ncbi:PDF receptor-like [Centruroides sculpturatus]|uniref:PDF receptor-like n=1 Tax=Centruroides sculpturatus TaxID=218467 RepID=UPI000C6D38D8|nr:PDF receptor-like [Centruroides sculpturatus]